jgi:hypothetical protein
VATGRRRTLRHELQRSYQLLQGDLEDLGNLPKRGRRPRLGGSMA